MLEELHKVVDIRSPAQEMAAADDMHLQVGDRSAEHHFLRQEGIDSQGD